MLVPGSRYRLIEKEPIREQYAYIRRVPIGSAEQPLSMAGKTCENQKKEKDKAIPRLP